MGLIIWIVVGLIAGWLAGQVMKGGGYGVLVDIILGILGGVVGGWVFGLLGIWPGGGMATTQGTGHRLTSWFNSRPGLQIRGRLSWRPLSFQIQNHFNTIATQKMTIPSTNNQPVV